LIYLFVLYYPMTLSPRRFVAVLLSVVLVVAAVPVAGGAWATGTAALAASDPPEATPDGTYTKSGQYNQWFGEAGAADASTLDVEIELTEADESHVDDLEDRGVEVRSVRGAVVQAAVAPAVVAEVRSLPYVEALRPAARMVTYDTVSEGVGVVGADVVHARGITGAGVKVGIIDSGFDVTNPEIADNVVAAESFSPDGDVTNGGATEHGTAVAELVVDVAPDAELYLAQAGTSLEYFEAVEWMRSQDVDVVSHSGGFLIGSHDGTDPTDLAAASLTADGITYVAAAGNSAQSHWEGEYTDTDGDSLHEFAPGTEVTFLNGGQPYSGFLYTALMWDDWDVSDQDYDLFLVQYVPDGPDVVVAQSTIAQDGTVPPVEVLAGTINQPAVYYLLIVNFDAEGSESLELFAYNILLTDAVPEGSVATPATANDVFVAGATNYATDQVEPFSSEGPTNDGRPALDVAAPDRVTTTALPSFAGTSASAPHVAGTVALLLQVDPSLTPADVERVIGETALDVGAAGYDLEAGYGRIDAEAAVDLALNGAQPPEDGTTVDVVLRGSPTGLAFYNVTLAAPADATIAAVEPGVLGGADFQVLAGGEGASFVTARAADYDRSVGSFVDDRVLFTVTFEGEVDAQTLALTATALVDDRGADIDSTRVAVVDRSTPSTPEPTPEPSPEPTPEPSPEPTPVPEPTPEQPPTEAPEPDETALSAE
jgi:subtilisin family serine protease